MNPFKKDMCKRLTNIPGYSLRESRSNTLPNLAAPLKKALSLKLGSLNAALNMKQFLNIAVFN